jgi:hypothetical protein
MNVPQKRCMNRKIEIYACKKELNMIPVMDRFNANSSNNPGRD